MVTNRDLASLFWIAVILILGIAWPKTRPILRSLVGAVLSRFFMVLVSLYLAWMLLMIAVANAIGLWSLDLLKDTVVWLVTVGLALIFRTNDATSPGFYRHQMRKIGLVGLVIALYLNLTTLPLIAEIALQFVIAWAGIAIAIGGNKPEFASAKRAGNRFLAVIGLAFFLYVGLWLASNWRTLDPKSIGHSLLLPVWLTLSALAFVFALSVVFNYELATKHLDWIADQHRAPWKAKLALVLGFRFRLRDLNSPGWNYDKDLVGVKSIREAFKVVGDHRRSLRKAEADARQAEQRLRGFAGVSGTDGEGRQLDQREFADTRSALQWIATCQTGWFRTSGGKYKPDLLEILSYDSWLKRLPADHGIHLVVAKNRRSWYAWRRTIGGYCFAIGAAKAPPDQWLYDGPEPPKGFPGKDPAWGSAPFGPDATNW